MLTCTDYIRKLAVNQLENASMKRKEVSLPEEVIKKLEAKALKDNRSLKNYMEQVLIKDSKK